MYQNRTNAIQQSRTENPRPETRPYSVQHDFDGSAELTTTLAHAISDVTGIDVTDTGFTLNDHLDPEALDQLFKPKSDGRPRANGHVGFTIWGYYVTVYSNGQIVVAPPQEQLNPQFGHASPV